MAKNTFQYKQTISVYRETFMETVVKNTFLNKKDLRVIMHLLTHLDSMTYKDVSAKRIAEDLQLSKKEVNESIHNLIIEGLLEEGSSGSVKNGLKLLF